jgi:hypothetical protein
VPTNIVFASDASVLVADEPHEVVTKLKQGAVQFEQARNGGGPVHLLNPALILYIEKVERTNGARKAKG